MASPTELFGVLLTSFLFNLIPFAGPSNLLIALNAALVTSIEPPTLGLLVALGSVSAKFIHYVVTFFVGGSLSEKRRERLREVGMKMGKWGFLALFIASATPVPDEPVIIPLGLMKYNPGKFCLAVFLGKISIAIPGAYVGQVGLSALSSIAAQEVLAVLSILLTVTITIILLKIDIRKTLQQLRKTGARKNNKTCGKHQEV